ncbi:MAG TPA: aminotransferase class V-fold PLP-dependent enzyme [Candidatus Enterosoma merdigallinarum]|nr:aminotransferase class V-fold PLP-dependent enzyme [Candidatus Enterosoma merdigallinarum]
MSFSPEKIRKDFPMYAKEGLYDGLPLVYLDNAATTFKPYSVIQSQDRYYTDITANAHRGDYGLAHAVDVAFEGARKEIADFIHALPEEVCFTSGDTMGLNEVAYGIGRTLSAGDEIVLSLEEHASNVLPWFNVAKMTGAVVRYAPLINGRITEESLKAVLSNKTKVVSFATVSNVLGYVLDVKSLAALAHSVGAIYVEDGAQSVPHMATDVRSSDVDFLLFSGHKMLGPVGIGVMYGKKALLERMEPLFAGGEMNARFSKTGNVSLVETPWKFEAGTQNIAGAMGLAEACRYLRSVGFSAIQVHEKKLRELAVDGLKANGNAILYNEDAESGIVTFNVKGVFAQDAAGYLASKGVYVRSGQHCAKLLPEVLSCEATVRASIYLYNTEEDIERLVQASKHAEDFLDVFFA